MSEGVFYVPDVLGDLAAIRAMLRHRARIERMVAAPGVLERPILRRPAAITPLRARVQINLRPRRSQRNPVARLQRPRVHMRQRHRIPVRCRRRILQRRLQAIPRSRRIRRPQHRRLRILDPVDRHRHQPTNPIACPYACPAAPTAPYPTSIPSISSTAA